MTKGVAREIMQTVRNQRAVLGAIREELDDLVDYLDLLEARTKEEAQPHFTQEQVTPAVPQVRSAGPGREAPLGMCVTAGCSP